MAKWVHPHVRGEYRPQPGTGTEKRGSSPRAWGIPAGGISCCSRWRFIPTCVGNTWRFRQAILPPSVHPHVRGEYTTPCSQPCSKAGSSPRAWGIRQTMPAQGQCPRFIPTCVGNTGKDDGTGKKKPVHPHVRGEYGRMVAMPEHSIGSSPRAWGIRRHRAHGQRRGRFIPTCVGNTGVRLYYGADWGGSSPRAWGILAAIWEKPRLYRFIPTCVGNTI